MNKVIDIINLCEDENDMDIINLIEDESVEIIIEEGVDIIIGGDVADEDADNLREVNMDKFWNSLYDVQDESVDTFSEGGYRTN